MPVHFGFSRETTTEMNVLTVVFADVVRVGKKPRGYVELYPSCNTR